MQARGGGVDRKNPLFWLFRFKRLLPESASWIDDCHLRGREAMQEQNSAYGLLEPTPEHEVIIKVTAQIPFDLCGHSVLE